MPKQEVTSTSPLETMQLFIEARDQRTTNWGIINETNEAVEIAFGQLTSRYDLPGYTKDTGTKILLQNGGPGAGAQRDPITDTNGVPIAASTYLFSVKVNDQDLNGREDANAGEYIVQALFYLIYSADLKKVNIIRKFEKLKIKQ